MAYIWLINGGDPNHLQVPGMILQVGWWQLKYFFLEMFYPTALLGEKWMIQFDEYFSDG